MAAPAEGPGRLVSAGYRLLLCHRRLDGVRPEALWGHWTGPRRRLVVEVAPGLGHRRYRQLHQLERGNLVYRALRLSRGRLLVTLLTALTRRRLPRRGRMPRPEPAWDVVEQFWYDSREALVRALTSADGRAAVRRLVDDQAPWTGVLRAVVAEDFPVPASTPEEAPAGETPAEGAPEVAVMFFLRARPGLSRGGMLDYWATDHEELVTSLGSALGFASYHQLHVRSGDELTTALEGFGGSGDGYDGVAELSYADTRVLVRGLFRLRTQAANLRLVKDEITFVDIPRSNLVMGRTWRPA